MKINGPPPRPIELKLLRGNPGRRALPKVIIKPRPGADCPAGLSPAAKNEWGRLLPELKRLGLLTRVDRAALAAYCEAWSDFCWAVTCIEAEGRVTTAGNGTDIPHPAVSIKLKAMQKIREFSAEFGFTPAARTRIIFAGAEEDGDEDDKFFGGPRPAPPLPPGRPRRKNRPA